MKEPSTDYVYKEKKCLVKSGKDRKRQEKTNFNVNPFSFNVENRLSRHIEQFVSPHRTVCFDA